ncbi:hypothetical protein KVR01_001675 [Diaporthe batatas]|uniref:uncharacterized protein n=1 Tax=Diaporthe batatas TaxID=748121 RepID=UPI001D041151|nr:uncharacterized protein KVR01_001675 [Diaporthe batatas]KAG8168926.1 hypothetical protein KVR01_001675 [Diaporthe batatas]
MPTMPITQAQPKCILEAANLHDQSQVDQLLRQRKICGWKTRPSDMVSWKARAEARTTTLFWIKPIANPDLRAGHVSLDRISDDPSSLKIADLFILPEHRGGGLARAAFQAVEKMATTEPKRYSEDEEMRLEYNKLTGTWPSQKGATNEDWYARMGYVTYEEKPAYPERESRPTGRFLLASFMKKEIRR